MESKPFIIKQTKPTRFLAKEDLTRAQRRDLARKEKRKYKKPRV